MKKCLGKIRVWQKAIAQTLSLNPVLDLSELYYLKVVVDGRLLDEIDPEPTLDYDAAPETKFTSKDHMFMEINVELVRIYWPNGFCVTSFLQLHTISVALPC